MSTHPNDLQRLAQKHGWEKGPLTFARVQRMGVREYEFHQAFNKTELERALAEPALAAQNTKNTAAEKVQRQWADAATREEHEAAIKEVQKFVARHPQFRADLMDNRTKLVDFLKARNLPISETTLTEAFQILGRDGALVLSEAAVGLIRIQTNGQTISIRREDLSVYQRRDKNLTVLEPETNICGSKLSRHSQLDILLSPHSPAIQERREQAAVSAKDYYKEHKELHETRVPPLIAVRFRQAVATLVSRHPELVNSDENAEAIRNHLAEKGLDVNVNNLEFCYQELRDAGALKTKADTVVSVHGGTKMVDYGRTPSDTQIPLPEKESLARKINSMSAAEYQAFLQNPVNRKAIDGQLAALAH